MMWRCTPPAWNMRQRTREYPTASRSRAGVPWRTPEYPDYVRAREGTLAGTVGALWGTLGGTPSLSPVRVEILLEVRGDEDVDHKVVHLLDVLGRVQLLACPMNTPRVPLEYPSSAPLRDILGRVQLRACVPTAEAADDSEAVGRKWESLTIPT